MISSRRIIQDYDLDLRTFGIVYTHMGKVVQAMTNRNGHRNHAASRHTKGWGGVRVNIILAEEVDRWLHEDALDEKSGSKQEILERLAFGDNPSNNSSDNSSDDLSAED